MSYLQLKNLTASYDKEIVLNNLSLDIKKGELLSLLGSSGCGKTTTLRIVSGFLKPISGSVILDDMDISQKPPNERGFGYVFQSYALFPHLTVEENVGFGLKQRKVKSDQIKVKVDFVSVRQKLALHEEEFDCRTSTVLISFEPL